MAGAIVMYDRMLSLGGYPARPDKPGATENLPPLHRWGAPIMRRRE
jgi:hypothetical protein